MKTTELKILAIDDNRDNLTTLGAVLADRLPAAGLLTSLDGARGLELARREDPDVILLDIVMPGLDGYAVCRRLKEDDALQAIPVLFLTSLGTDRDSRIAAIDAGAEGFLSKPFDEIELVAQIRAMAKLKAAHRFQRMEREELAALVVERTHALQQELEERKRAEEEIRRLNAELEERVRLRTAELEAANRELEAFSYSVSHDLRAPLRAIDGFSRILLDEYAPRLDAEGERLCAIIGDSTRRMGQLIDDLLAFSRLGRTEFKTAPVNMTVLARDAFYEAATGQDPERIDFRLAALPPAKGDPALLRQVWINLLGNAVKFSAHAPRPVISVEAAQNAEEIVYTVRDNGAGFDMRYADKLFGVFQRLHGEKEFPGTGLGLALAQRIVQRHGGRIWGEGVPGNGATFFFTLKPKGT